MSDYFIQLTASFSERYPRRRLTALLDHGTVRDALEAAGFSVERLDLLPLATAGDRTLERLWQRARRHGEESEPEHEIGDLQELSRLCWELLTDDQRKLVAARSTRETEPCRFCQQGDSASTSRSHGNADVDEPCSCDEGSLFGEE